MKKLLFWLIIDVVFYSFYLVPMYCIWASYMSVLDIPSGDGRGLGILFDIGISLLLSSVFIISQWGGTLNFIDPSFDREKYVKSKRIIFFFNDLILFIFLSFTPILRYINLTDLIGLDWLFYYFFYCGISYLVYYILTSELKWLLE